MFPRRIQQLQVQFRFNFCLLLHGLFCPGSAGAKVSIICFVAPLPALGGPVPSQSWDPSTTGDMGSQTSRHVGSCGILVISSTMVICFIIAGVSCPPHHDQLSILIILILSDEPRPSCSITSHQPYPRSDLETNIFKNHSEIFLSEPHIIQVSHFGHMSSLAIYEDLELAGRLRPTTDTIVNLWQLNIFCHLNIFHFLPVYVTKMERSIWD